MIRQSILSRRSWLRDSTLMSAALGIGTASGSPEKRSALEGAGSVTDVGNIRVGHFTSSRRPTGCTVLIFEGGAVAGVDVRGAAPGTRETDLLQPINTVERVNAIVLSGGSAFGLDSASGVMRYLEENRQGFHLGSIVVPIVPAAILFDLNVGDPSIRPDAQAGYAACQAASADHIAEGNVGAGAGATVGKFFGLQSAMKSGLATASLQIEGTDLIVGAIVAVNAVGDVIDRRTGKILAGALSPDKQQFRDSTAQILNGALIQGHVEGPRPGTNTTIGVVTTNAVLTKTQMTKVAQMAHDGFARTISPVHTASDGDTIFAASTLRARTRSDITTIGVAAAEVMSRAVNRAVVLATSIDGYPAHRDLTFATS